MTSVSDAPQDGSRGRNLRAQDLAAMRARVEEAGAGRFALIVANGSHPNPHLKLPAVNADAEALRRLLADPECGCFPPENILVLRDERATKNNVRLELDRLNKRAGPDSLVWFFFLGHANSEDGEIYFLTHDTELEAISGTALPGAYLALELGKFKTDRLIVVLDCCHAALFKLLPNKNRSPLTPQDLLDGCRGKGWVVLAAAERGEKAGETSRGFFSQALEEGLYGEADADRDGVVTLEELWPYVAKRVPALGRQTPVLKGEHSAGFGLTLNRNLVRRTSEAAQRIERAGAALRRWTGFLRGQLSTDEAKAAWEMFNEPERSAGVDDHTAASLTEAILGQLDAQECPALVKSLAHHFWEDHRRGPRSAQQDRLSVLLEQLAGENARRLHWQAEADQVRTQNQSLTALVEQLKAENQRLNTEAAEAARRVVASPEAVARLEAALSEAREAASRSEAQRAAAERQATESEARLSALAGENGRLGGEAIQALTREQRLVDAVARLKSSVSEARKLALAAQQRLEAVKHEQMRRGPSVRQNDLCPCGSGKRYRSCCSLR